MSLKDEIREQRNLRFSEESIMANMFAKGYAAEEAMATYKEVLEEEYEERKKHNPILYNKFLPLIILVILYYFFFHFLSVGTIVDYVIALSIIGGILFAGITFMSITRLFPSSLEEMPLVVIGLTIAVIFVFAFKFVFFSFDMKQKELKEYGVMTTAKVIDGRSFDSRKSKTASLKIYFITGANEPITTKINISFAEFNTHYEGEKINIIYSKRDPNIVNIVRDPSKWEKSK